MAPKTRGAQTPAPAGPSSSAGPQSSSSKPRARTNVSSEGSPSKRQKNNPTTPGTGKRVQFAPDTAETSPEPADVSPEDEEERGGNEWGDLAILPPTPFAGPYTSTLMEIPEFADEYGHLLQHLNCSYLSTKGVAPSLEELKQHAQALTVLIKTLNMTTTVQGGIPDAGNSGGIGSSQDNLKKKKRRKGKDKELEEGDFKADEAFDWLNDLSTVYTTYSTSSQLPLTAILNRLSSQAPYEKICPLTETRSEALGHPNHPYGENMEDMVCHADACLTWIDHELSASGGLLSLLPLEGPEKEAADATILGQWIHFTRLMVARCHELERAYGVCMEALAGEAVVPRERLSAAAPTERSIRYPTTDDWLHIQDKFVVAGWTDTIRKALQAKLQSQGDVEALIGPPDEESDGRGIVWTWCRTKYVQLRGGRTIFIIPDFESLTNESEHVTEKKPTVVQVVKPEFKARSSAWEAKHENELRQLREMVPEAVAMQSRIRELEGNLQVLGARNGFDVERDNRWLSDKAEEVNKSIRELEEKRANMRQELEAEIRREMEDRERAVAAREEKVNITEEENERRIVKAVRDRIKNEEDTLRWEHDFRVEMAVKNAVRALARAGYRKVAEPDSSSNEGSDPYVDSEKDEDEDEDEDE